MSEAESKRAANYEEDFATTLFTRPNKSVKAWMFSHYHKNNLYLSRMWQRKWKYKGPHNKIFSISHIPSVLSFSFLSRKENVWQRKLYKLFFFMKDCHAWNVGATIFNYLMWCLHLNQKVQLILENEGRIRSTILKKVQIQFSDFYQHTSFFEECFEIYINL